MSKNYGEIKTRKNIFPSMAKELVEKNVSILISQSKVSEKTAQILHDGNVLIYDGISPEKAKEVTEEAKEKNNERE